MSEKFDVVKSLINLVWSGSSIYLCPVPYCNYSNYLLYFAPYLSVKLLLGIAFKV